MFWRKQFQKKERLDDQPVKEKMAGAIVMSILKLQRCWVVFMQWIAGKLKVRKKKWMVMVFVVCSGGCSLFIIAGSLSGAHHRGLHITSIRSPKYVTRAGDEKILSPRPGSTSEISALRRFRFYMDSLAATKSGHLIYDSILRLRPGLMDSVTQLETLYQLSSKSN